VCTGIRRRGSRLLCRTGQVFLHVRCALQGGGGRLGLRGGDNRSRGPIASRGGQSDGTEQRQMGERSNRSKGKLQHESLCGGTNAVGHVTCTETRAVATITEQPRNPFPCACTNFRLRRSRGADRSLPDGCACQTPSLGLRSRRRESPLFAVMPRVP
jgi:hypothetical protein